VQSVHIAADSTTLSSEPGEGGQPFNVTLNENSLRAHRTETPSLDVSVTKENLLEWFQQMTLMRKMEQAAGSLYQAKLIRGFCHLSVGQVSTHFFRHDMTKLTQRILQEAVSIGLHSSMEKDDKLITSYRCHPFAVLRGGSVKGVLAELLGKGYC
jgi:pyruvate dehydrogenase E1 component alpha subunit